MDSKLLDKLIKREKEGTLRSLSFFNGAIDFFSNDYLGLSSIKITSQLDKFGSTGSRLLSGNSKEAILCEQSLADFFKVPAALVFNSGYDANVGFFSSVPQRNDTILFDEYIHASVRDGIRLSLANSFSFKHNSFADLKKKIKASKGTIYIAVESLYSMNGDFAPLEEICALSEENKCYLIVDEAHSCGVFGESGKGLVDGLKDPNAVFARIITFGKAYGGHGAFVLGSEKLIQFLINFSRSFIYTTALPPKEYLRIKEIVKAEEIPQLQVKLQENIALFRSECVGLNLISEKRSPIQIVKLGTIEITKEIAEILQETGIAVKPIFSPTVKKGDENIRICIHSTNSKEEILLLASTLIQHTPIKIK